MALVAYGSSDSESEHEDEDTPISSIPILSVPKKERETVKITIPSLQEFKDEDVDPQPTKKLKTNSGSGLFSILPPPKNSVSSSTNNFTPYILTKKKESKVTPSTSKQSKKEFDSLGKSSPGTSVDSDPEISQNDHEKSSAPVFDYFSLDDSSNKYELPQIQSESVLFSSLPKPAQSTELYEPSSSSLGLTSSSNDQAESSFAQQSWDENYQDVVSLPPAQTSFLNDEGFKKIKGRRDMGDIDIIDINAGDQLTGKDQWLMQNLTEETVQKSSKKRHDMPTQQQKRKHQITYLAFQAKERELDLKNQWSLNSRTRRETQAKYGF